MKIFSSLSDMGKALGVRTKKPDTKVKKCRRCGGILNPIEGTNVLICTGTLSDGKECNNKVLQGIKSESFYDPTKPKVKPKNKETANS